MFLATMTMFASLAEDVSERRKIIETVGIFVGARLGFAVIAAASLYVAYMLKLDFIIMFAAISLLVLVFVPPSSLIDDIFVVQGADEAISDTVKRDSAIMNLIFVSAVVGVFVLVETAQFLRANLVGTFP